MKQSLRLWSALLLGVQCVSSSLVIAEKEDISPVSEVSFGNESVVEEDSVKTSSVTLPAVSSQLSETTGTQEASGLPKATTVEELVDLLATQPLKETKLTILQTPSPDIFYAEVRETIMRDELVYVRLTDEKERQSSVLLQTNHQQLVQALLPVDDLMTYAADLMNREPDVYSGTDIDTFYQAFQKAPELFTEKYIISSTDAVQYAHVYADIKATDQLMLEVVTEWLLTGAEPSEQTESTLLYTMDEDSMEMLTELMKSLEIKHPELDHLYELFPDGYLGTIKVDFAQQEIGVGFISPYGAVEYFARVKSLPIIIPSVDQLVSEETFAALSGAHLFGEQLLPSDQDVTDEEEGE